MALAAIVGSIGRSEWCINDTSVALASACLLVCADNLVPMSPRASERARDRGAYNGDAKDAEPVMVIYAIALRESAYAGLRTHADTR